MYNNLEVKIHTNLMKNMTNESILYWVCRAIDTSGSGKTIINRKTFCNSFNISERTFYRYLNYNIENNLLTLANTNKGDYTFYYSGLNKLCKQFNLNEQRPLGVSGYVLTSNLKTYLKTLIELLIISKQKKARIYLTNSEIPIHENPFNLLKNQEDNECKVLSNLITLNFNEFSYGINKQKIAEELNISTNKVYNNLKESNKVYCIKLVEEKEYLLNKLDEECNTNLYFKNNINYYRHFPFIIKEDIVLSSCKTLNYNIRKLFINN